MAVIIRAARAPFLLLTPVCVLLGASKAIAAEPGVDTFLFSLVLAGALLAHISVNLLNEYLDFRSGLDLQTRRTPFSGGSGALPENPDKATGVLVAGGLSLVAVVLIGMALLFYRGAALAPLGLVGVVIIVTYTTVINRVPLLCLIAPGLGFGVLVVTGTHFVLTAGYANAPWLAATVSFFLVNNLLLLNQYPDLDADAAAGRRHFPLAYGVSSANLMYGVFALAAVGAIVAGVINSVFPFPSIAALLPLSLAPYALSGAIRYRRDVGHHPQYLAANVAVALLVPLVLALTLIYGGMSAIPDPAR